MPESEQKDACEACNLPMRSDTVAITLWTDDGLVVVEDIRAQVCDACGEQYYDDATQTDLRRLSSGGFAKKDVVRTMNVPVYSLQDRGKGEAMEDVA